ncbi:MULTISPECIES: GNAT family N-acetyltransferase [Streptomyces]|uniref:GNAT family N-acetyltransferase n=1 Tax=Streptomyces tricolor TaxID=68277 RepID=A0ABS9JWG8_9ACTN|nr:MULTISPECIES: GNAT family protein [Streptomyces]MCG0069907.1 GNAT family N-acetyltransferase [Streptomyces tricolor]MYU29752.1 GNAT family N-acetyltransferase [Streptomyces sp. SID7810]
MTDEPGETSETEETDLTAGARSAVCLRAVRDDDLEALFAYEHDPEAVRRSRFTPRPRDAFFRHWRERVLGDPDCLVRTVTVGGEVAGSAVSWTQDGRRFVGYWLGRPYWGRGIGTRALGLFLDLEPVRPLYADPFAGNTASVRLLERHGFAHAGTIRHGTDEHVLLVLGGPAGASLGDPPADAR